MAANGMQNPYRAEVVDEQVRFFVAAAGSIVDDIVGYTASVEAWRDVHLELLKRLAGSDGPDVAFADWEALGTRVRQMGGRLSPARLRPCAEVRQRVLGQMAERQYVAVPDDPFASITAASGGDW